MEAVAVHAVSLTVPEPPFREPITLYGSGDVLPDLPRGAPGESPPVHDPLFKVGRQLSQAFAALGLLSAFASLGCLVMAGLATWSSSAALTTTRFAILFAALAVSGAALLSLSEMLRGRWALVFDPETRVVRYERRLGPWIHSRAYLGPGEVEGVALMTEHYIETAAPDTGELTLSTAARRHLVDLHVPVLVLAGGKHLRTTLATPYPLLARRCALELCRQLGVELDR